MYRVPSNESQTVVMCFVVGVGVITMLFALSSCTNNNIIWLISYVSEQELGAVCKKGTVGVRPTIQLNSH